MRDPHKLQIYVKSFALAVRVADIVRTFSPRLFRSLAEQLDSAAQSIPANIQEGCSESSRREFARFLQIALASCGEVAHHLQFAQRTGALSVEMYEELNNQNTEVRRMLASLLRVVRDELNADDDNNSVEAMQRRRKVQRAKTNDDKSKRSRRRP
jgi:four helix bundle protein